jgi:hypothetical protein
MERVKTAVTFFFSCGAEDQIQGLVHTRYMLHHYVTPPALFVDFKKIVFAFVLSKFLFFWSRFILSFSDLHIALALMFHV